MATLAAENNEADSGSSVLASLMSKTDDNDRDERVTGSNNNYDSSAESLLKCNRCDFETVSPSALTNHVTISHTTTNEVELEPNIVTENNNPPSDKLHRKMFECDVCNMKFSNGANMRRHKMRHTGVKPYECRVCQKRFFRKDHLAEHFTTHTKTLPYHCPICNRGFQRQIAMRAHFQNEHVGQNDLVKSCPLCQYRAGSMKSLRIHFFNRHGIDLDNPGPPGSQSSIIAAAAQQGFPEGSLDQLAQLSGNLSVSVGAANYSDSGDSTGNRSTDNATPPMHFLTPHVEISMADAPSGHFTADENQRIPQAPSNEAQMMVNGDSPNSPQSGDSNSNAPSSSHIQVSSLRLEQETSLTPSISLIPIKQEPTDDGSYDSSKKNGPINLSLTDGAGSLTSLIKVSPLKSLLRDDLKRKIMSKANSSHRGRSTSSPNANSADASPDGATTTNGAVITSTGSEQNESLLWRAMGKKLHCLFCGIGFPDQTLYFLHKGCHSDANPWKCNICGEQCCNVYEFNSHLLSKSHQ